MGFFCIEKSGKASLKRQHWNRDLKEVRDGTRKRAFYIGVRAILCYWKDCMRKSQRQVWLKSVVNAKSGRRGQGGRQGPAYEGSLKRNLDFAQSVKRSHLTVGSHGRHEVLPLRRSSGYHVEDTVQEARW